MSLRTYTTHTPRTHTLHTHYIRHYAEGYQPVNRAMAFFSKNLNLFELSPPQPVENSCRTMPAGIDADSGADPRHSLYGRLHRQKDQRQAAEEHRFRVSRRHRSTLCRRNRRLSAARKAQPQLPRGSVRRNKDYCDNHWKTISSSRKPAFRCRHFHAPLYQ